MLLLEQAIAKTNNTLLLQIKRSYLWEILEMQAAKTVHFMYGDNKGGYRDL